MTLWHSAQPVVKSTIGTVAKRTIRPASYKQTVPAIGLSLERYTARVPNDGSYYVLLGDEVRGRYRNKREALELYGSILRESGYTPAPVESSAPRNEAVEAYLDDLESYWTESHKHSRRGGKGRF